MPVRTRLIAGNWKMNRTAMETEQFLGRFDAEMGKAELLICMPFTDLYLAEKYLAGTGIKWGGAKCVSGGERRIYRRNISWYVKRNRLFLCHLRTFGTPTDFM